MSSPQTPEQVAERPRVVIVVPTYNEAENLPVLFERLSSLHIDGMRILVVDDNSPDGTGDIADRLAESHPGAIEVLHRPGKMGLGRAYVHGFTRAIELKPDAIVQMDADMSHPPERLPQMIEMLKEYDVVTASRYVPGGGGDPEWPLLRRLISRYGSLGMRLVLGLKVRDASSGFKAFRRSALETIGIAGGAELVGFGFQAEVAYRCQKAGLRVAESPFIFLERSEGKSKMSLGIMIEAFASLTRLRLRGIRRNRKYN